METFQYKEIKINDHDNNKYIFGNFRNTKLSSNVPKMFKLAMSVKMTHYELQ